MVKLSDKLQQAEAEDDTPASRRRKQDSKKSEPSSNRGSGSKEDPKKKSSGSSGSKSSGQSKGSSGSKSSGQSKSSTASKASAGTVKASDAEKWVEAKRTVRDAVLKELAPRVSRADDLEGLEDEVTALVDRLLRQEDLKVSVAERRAFVEQMISDILGYGALDELLADPEVTEVMCNDFDEIWVERGGRVTKSDVAFADRQEYRNVIERIVSAVGRRVDESSPMVDARLPDGSRVNAIVPPLAVHGPCLTIRRFSEDPFTAQDLIGFGSLSDDLAMVLEACVRGRLNILVSGGTATGKTTLLNVLSRFIPEHERIITVEDAAELQLQQPHVVTLESRPPNAEGQGHVAIRDLVRNTLRMRPDRIVVGECRGGEALDMLQAMNTGHEGSLTTLHANSPRDALQRLEMLVLMAGVELPEKAIREMIASAIDVVVQITRLPDGSRKITSVQEVHGMEDRTIVLQELFTYEAKMDKQGRYVGLPTPTGLRPRFLEKLQVHGVDVPAAVFRTGAPRRAASSGRKR